MRPHDSVLKIEFHVIKFICVLGEGPLLALRTKGRNLDKETVMIGLRGKSLI